ncbi:MAG: FHA domain-containing protein [Armatimonadota bacterium]
MIGNFLLWVAWAAFGAYIVWLLWKRYLPAVLQAPPELPAVEAKTAGPAAAPAWLFCEDGSALDRKVQWFPLRPGGRTVVGSLPRSATADTSYLYLTADDIAQDHLLLRYNAELGRYEAEPLGEGTVLHNNEPLERGRRAELTDGDTLDLGQLSRFRYTLRGPEGA